MTKLSWKWFVLVGSVFSFLFYMALTGKSYLSMRQMSLGEPDPYYFIIMGCGLVFAFWFMFVCMAQNISTEIGTEVGGFAVHSLKPVAVIDPLARKNMSVDGKVLSKLDSLKEDETKLSEELQKVVPSVVTPDIVRRFQIDWNIKDVEDFIIEEDRRFLLGKLRDSYKYKDYMSEKDITSIRLKNNWDIDGPEIEHYIVQYQIAIDGLKPIGLYPDGGTKLLGIHGFRWWIGGTSLLAVPMEYVIPHGDGGVCVASVKNYMDVKQLQGMPRWFQRGVVDAFSQFQPGKHIITFGNRPHPKAVRAMVERNKDATDEELWVRPKYIWTLGLQESNIDSDIRKGYLDDCGTAFQEEAAENKEKLDIAEKRIQTEKSQGLPEPKEDEPDVKE